MVTVYLCGEARVWALTSFFFFFFLPHSSVCFELPLPRSVDGVGIGSGIKLNNISTTLLV